MKSNILVGVGNGVTAGAFWGLVFLAPQVLGNFSALQLSAARYLAYGAVAALLLAARWRAVAPRLGRAEWGALVYLSLLGNILYYVFLASAVQWAGGASTSLIIGLLPVVVTLVGARDEGAMKLSALMPPLALCLFGVGLVGVHALSTETGASDLATRAAGLLCAFGALASWSVYSVRNSRWLARRPDISSHDWSLLTGIVTGALALLLVIPAFSHGMAGHDGADWLRFWAVAATVAIFASVVGNAFWNRASRLLPLTLTGQMIIFETLFALLYGFLWDRRWPSRLEVLAIVCLVSGVLWCASLHRRRDARALQV
ncbi:DMT family transporter [Herbaspirillum sp. RV1423]|uniref:DMT family transporter n=1 Tax=Herbaspirillum sp. RV1423 TaxID=1443993 RepID=UPI0004B313AD|nr:DMT family transporter [Herbaspirillum sp. RV1423]